MKKTIDSFNQPDGRILSVLVDTYGGQKRIHLRRCSITRRGKVIEGTQEFILTPDQMDRFIEALHEARVWSPMSIRS